MNDADMHDAIYGGMAMRARRIAENRGPVFPRPADMIVKIVPVGQVVRNDDGAELVVDATHMVQKGGTLFVTQAHWDALVTSTEVRKI